MARKTQDSGHILTTTVAHGKSGPTLRPGKSDGSKAAKTNGAARIRARQEDLERRAAQMISVVTALPPCETGHIYKHKVLELTQNGFFERLEREGERTLNQQARELFVDWVVVHRDVAADAKRRRPRYDKAQALIRDIEKLATKLETGRLVLWTRPRNHPHRNLPETLRLFASDMRMDWRWALRPRGGRYNEHNDLFIKLMADLYKRIGGRVARSTDGPFARFLTVAWGALGEGRSSQPSRLVERAKEIL